MLTILEQVDNVIIRVVHRVVVEQRARDLAGEREGHRRELRACEGSTPTSHCLHLAHGYSTTGEQPLLSYSSLLYSGCRRAAKARRDALAAPLEMVSS